MEENKRKTEKKLNEFGEMSGSILVNIRYQMRSIDRGQILSTGHGSSNLKSMLVSWDNLQDGTSNAEHPICTSWSKTIFVRTDSSLSSALSIATGFEAFKLS